MMGAQVMIQFSIRYHSGHATASMLGIAQVCRLDRAVF
jgi:hypothetical protein